MAILRDAKTGQGVASSLEPDDLLPIYDSSSYELIWDDVGENFNVDALRERRNERIEEAQEILSSEEDEEIKEAANENLLKEKKRIDKADSLVSDVEEKVEKAHQIAEDIHS